jgi:hypothetical protein
MDNTIEIIREARKAGLQTACIMFAMFMVVAGLFAFYIYQSYKQEPITMTAMQDGTDNSLEQINGKAIN